MSLCSIRYVRGKKGERERGGGGERKRERERGREGGKERNVKVGGWEVQIHDLSQGTFNLHTLSLVSMAPTMRAITHTYW